LTIKGVGTLTVDDEAVSAAASYLGLARHNRGQCPRY
jgi:hypothetical protein